MRVNCLHGFHILAGMTVLTMCCLVSAVTWADMESLNTGTQQNILVSEDRQVFSYDYFNVFKPQTARDMIDRLPGFSLDSGNELRGFGATGGNVLIDGRRPSSKSGGIEESLDRIPANDVARIELIRGVAGSSETTTQSVVANVIRAKKKRSVRWQAQFELAADGKVYPRGELALIKKIGEWETATKVNAFWERYPLTGTRISRDTNNALTFSQLEDRASVFTDAKISSEASRLLADGVFTLSGQFGRNVFKPLTERLGFDQRFPDNSPDERFIIDQDRESIEGEFSMDWSRPFGEDWSFKIISLSSFSDTDNLQISTVERPLGTSISRTSIFTQFQNAYESIIRVTMVRGGERRFKPEFGFETAYNKLDSRLSLQIENASGTSTISLPAADVSVEELRGEAFANLIWRVAKKLTVETGIITELSTIKVSGDADNSQSFLFFKPFASLIYDVRPGIQLRLGARQTVGQLDFSDFAASASASDDRLIAGNPELGPEQTTRAFATLDLRTQEHGALNLEIFHEWHDDVLEQVTLPSGASGLGNADNGREWGITANASYPLTTLLPGGLLEMELEILGSSITDPVTGEKRDISEVSSPHFLVEFRQDIADKQITWGVSYQAKKDTTEYFTDEENRTRDGEIFSVFIETTRFWGIKSNLTFIENGAPNFIEERLFFETDRLGSFTGSQLNSRDRNRVLTLTFSGQFN